MRRGEAASLLYHYEGGSVLQSRQYGGVMRGIKATDEPFRNSFSLLNLLKKQERSLFLIFKVLFKVLLFFPLLCKSENSFTEKTTHQCGVECDLLCTCATITLLQIIVRHIIAQNQNHRKDGAG